MTDERRRPDGFQATARIGGARSTRRPLITTGVVAALLAVAIAKPWDRPGAGPPALPTPSSEIGLAASNGPDGSSRGAPVPSTPGALAIAPPTTNAALLDAATARARWGIRAIVASAASAVGSPRLSERWADAAVPATGPPVPGSNEASLADGPLGDPSDLTFALGVTTPPDALALDVRFWRVSEDRGWARILPKPIPGPEPSAWLWRPDDAWSTADGTWPSGTYRLDVLLGTRIVRLEVVVPGDLVATGWAPTPNPFAQPVERALDAVAPGPFVIGDFGPTGVPLAAAEPFDEREAWLAPFLGTGFVGQAYATSVSAVGVAAPSDDAPTELLVEQVSGLPTPAAIGVDLESVRSRGGSVAALVGRPLGGHLVPDGLWRLTASWPGGRTASWEVQISPGIAPATPTSPLEALSRWRAARDVDASPWPVVTVDPPIGDPMVSATCDPRTAITSATDMIGVALPRGAVLRSVQALLLDVSRTPSWTVWFTGEPVDGLAVVAIPNGGLAAGSYDVVLHLADATRSWSALQRICVTP